MNYYNEIDSYAARWLQNLMDAGHIPTGDIDTRSIEDVTPNDLRGYTQCHFFAGIAGWPLALALAGWPSSQPVWTGSCPCQPFSVAGKGAGFADQRHLWPAWFHLIRECKPATIFGEQVASKAVDPWIDLVHADLENMGYAFGCVPFPAAGIGASHIRDRTFWVADASGTRLAQREWVVGVSGEAPGAIARQATKRGGVHAAIGLGHAGSAGLSEQRRQRDESEGFTAASPLGRLANANQFRQQSEAIERIHYAQHHLESRGGAEWLGHADGNHETPQPGVSTGPQPIAARDSVRPGPTNGLWRNADWLACRDGKWRPVEPGTFPLAHGISNRVGRLRAYGNAIVPQAAAEFIGAYIDTLSTSLEVANG